MFIQIIQGRCSDEAALKRATDVWLSDLAPGAHGWLGGTYGLTDASEFVGIVRFESREAAARNSARPEQEAWWEGTHASFDGEVTFHDCEDATMFLDGGSDDAGFVQVIEGRVTDPEGFRTFMSQPMDMLHEQRPEIIGGTVALDADGWFCETVAFRSEAEARAGEQREMPAEAAKQWAEVMRMTVDVSYLDLHHPWFGSASGSERSAMA